MSIFEFLQFRPFVARSLPAGRYAFVHLFEQEAGTQILNGSVRVAHGSMADQMAALADTLDLHAQFSTSGNPSEVIVYTYLSPMGVPEEAFRDRMVASANRGLLLAEGFSTPALLGGDVWAHRITTFCGTWLIELNTDDPELTNVCESL